MRMLDLIFPPICFGCSEFLLKSERDGGVCARCAHTLFTVDSPRCPQCALPRKVVAGVDDLCSGCLSRPPAFDATWARWLYDGPVRQAIRRAKASDDEASLLALAGPMTGWFEEVVERVAPAVWCAVPAHDADLRRRGWDPPRRLLGELTRRCAADVELGEAIEKVAPAPKQASLGRRDRWKSRDVFRHRQRITGTVALFDDVMTTGATMHHAAKALKKAGAERVVAVVVARTA